MTAAIHFEVKKHAVRQTADGWVVSFVVHPNDMDSTFAVSPLGTRYMLAVAQIGDDEQPVSPAGTQPQTKGSNATVKSPLKDTRQTPAGERHKTPAERAVIRAALLPKDERFRAWANRFFDFKGNYYPFSEEGAAQFIREQCCFGNSRSLIAEHPEYMDRFLAMETEFKMDVGELARPR